MADGAVWWERHPERLPEEEAALREAGFPYEIDQEALAAGVLVMRVEATVEGCAFDLLVIFPDLYPYFPPGVIAPEERFPRHQSPDGTLCLLGRESVRWDPEQTLAEHLSAQLPRLLEAVNKAGTDASADLEVPQGEPYSFYYDYMPGAYLLVDSSWELPQGGGTIRVGYRSPLRAARDGKKAYVRVRGAVLEVFDEDGDRVVRAPDAWWEAFPDNVTDMPWVRLVAPVEATDTKGFIESLPEEVRTPATATFKTVGTDSRRGGKCRVHITAVLFQEELQWQNDADGWAFLVRHASNGPSYLARAYRYGVNDYFQRIPELRPLREKCVLVVGAGGLGAPAVLELARAGIRELRLMDGDVVDPATTVRWPVGLPAADAPKVDLLSQIVRDYYPYTDVTRKRMRLGTATQGENNQYETLLALFEGADLVLDGSAEFAVHHVLSDLAAQYDIPYLYVNATQGGWGGLAARIQPSRGTGCWRCLQHRIYGAAPDIEDAPEDPEGSVQAYGCADPTFTATGFDMGTLSLAAVRLAVATLCREHADGYPDLPWDALVVSLRTQDGTPTFTAKPHWLIPHPDCCGQT